MGSVLSIADILANCTTILKVRPDWHDWPDRDRFILSKGHAGAGVYAALALAGFLEKSTLTEHFSNGSIFQVMCHKGRSWSGLSTGSLGHGLSVATGMALGAKQKSGLQRFMLSDGEMNEGSNWENSGSGVFAYQTDRHHRLQQTSKPRKHRKHHGA